MDGAEGQPWWWYTGPTQSCGFQAWTSLLKGGSLTWNEMRLHLPSSTHSGDKHSSIPERPRLRQGPDRAVHLANRVGRGEGWGEAQAPEQLDGSRESLVGGLSG